jgi:hypothetical protein
MKITETELKKLVKEAVDKKLATLKEDAGTDVPSAKGIVAFTKKFDDFLTKTIEEARKLADDGEALIDSNLLNHPEVGTRNEMVIHRVGMLRTIANGMSTFFERVRRFS